MSIMELRPLTKRKEIEMLFTRVNGKYSLEARNLTEEEFYRGLQQISEMLHLEKDRTEDIMFITDLIEDKVN